VLGVHLFFFFFFGGGGGCIERCSVYYLSTYSNESVRRQGYWLAGWMAVLWEMCRSTIQTAPSIEPVFKETERQGPVQLPRYIQYHTYLHTCVPSLGAGGGGATEQAESKLGGKKIIKSRASIEIRVRKG